MGTEPERVPLPACPEAVLQDDALAQREQFLAQPPEALLEADAHVFVVIVDAESVLPLVGAQAHGPQVQGQLSGERRLARTRQATNQEQSSLSHEAAPHIQALASWRCSAPSSGIWARAWNLLAISDVCV